MTYTDTIRARFGGLPSFEELARSESMAMRQRAHHTSSGGKSGERLEAERTATQSVIIAALAKPGTVNDICAKTGMHYDRVLHHLNALRRAGKVTNDKTHRPIIWGVV
jgi:predicted Rossmann fold nucleotide-binding protein DprA/Smf involved in DNA uptake